MASRAGVRWLSTVGKVLIGLGVLVALFAAYQVWGTGIEEARAQRSLENEFEELLARPPAPTSSTRPVTTTTPATTAPESTAESTVASTRASAPPTTDPATSDPSPVLPFVPEPGEPVARIEIDAIGVDKIVVEGVSVRDLRKGPGHYHGTPLPGELGNAAIAGHRTTYGAPFYRVDELEPGDAIVVTTVRGRFVYRVQETRIVRPTDLSVLEATEEATLTLTACHPRYSARQRIVVKAVLDADDSAEAVPPATSAPPPSTTAPAPGTGPAPSASAPAPSDDATPDTIAVSPGALQEGWFDDAAAWPHAIGWGVLLGATLVGVQLLSRRANRWLVYAASVPVVLVVLWFFFGNVNRLLPPAL